MPEGRIPMTRHNESPDGDTGSGDAPPSLAQQRELARTMTSPPVHASHAIRQWSGLDGTPFLGGLIEEMNSHVAQVVDGNLDRPTAVLVAQSETLNEIFYALIRSAFEYRGHPYQEEKVRLALRVQTQYRATVDCLANMKSPRSVAYVQQANIGHAVQVNSGLVLSEVCGTRPTELLEEKRGNQWLDTGKANAAGGSNSSLEAMGAINRAEDAPR